MRIQRHDDDDVRELVECGSSSWNGPRPLASQARWAEPADRRPLLRTAAGFALGFGFTVVVFGLTMTAASQSPGGAASAVMRLVSHVFPGPPGTPEASGTPGALPSPPESAGPSTTALAATPAVTSRPAARPAPSPYRWGEPFSRSGEPFSRPSPLPQPSASASPSPSPSRPPDQ